MIHKNDLQNREGLPDVLLDETRFFVLPGRDKDILPPDWNNPDKWIDIDDVPEDKYFGCSICKGSNYLFIDCDHVRSAETGKIVPWVRDVLKRIFDIAPTYYEYSMSGTGLHYICDLGSYEDLFGRESNSYTQIIVAMDPKKYNDLSKEKKAKVPKIEFFYHTEGRYVYLTGKHKKLYQVATDEQAANIFSELLKVREEFHKKYSETPIEDEVRFEIDDATRKRILDALPYISANSRETWVTVGIALHHCGFPFEVWDEWSKYTDQRAGKLCDKYKANETPLIWKSFHGNKSHWNAGTIINLAKENGFSTEVSEPEPMSQEEAWIHDWDDGIESMEDVQEIEHEWLSYGYLPKGEITIIGSDGGIGKTTLWCNVAAALSSGKPSVFDEALGAPEEWQIYSPLKILVFSGEASASKDLKKKLRKSGATMKNIRFIDLHQKEILKYKFSSQELEQVIRRRRPDVVVFDPLQSFITQSVRMAERNQMRNEMMSLSVMCARLGVTAIVIAHTNKRAVAFGRDKLADSADLWDLSRSVIMMGRVPKEEGETRDLRYISHEKSNNSKLQKTILFTTPDGVLKFEGLSDKRQEDFISNRTGNNATTRDAAKVAVIEFLEADGGGEKDTNELTEYAAALSISKRTLERAKSELKEEGKIMYVRPDKVGAKWKIKLAE